MKDWSLKPVDSVRIAKSDSMIFWPIQQFFIHYFKFFGKNISNIFLIFRPGLGHPWPSLWILLKRNVIHIYRFDWFLLYCLVEPFYLGKGMWFEFVGFECLVYITGLAICAKCILLLTDKTHKVRSSNLSFSSSCWALSAFFAQIQSLFFLPDYIIMFLQILQHKRCDCVHDVFDCIWKIALISLPLLFRLWFWACLLSIAYESSYFSL